MITLVDTSVWIDHLRRSNEQLTPLYVKTIDHVASMTWSRSRTSVITRW